MIALHPNDCAPPQRRHAGQGAQPDARGKALVRGDHRARGRHARAREGAATHSRPCHAPHSTDPKPRL
jgi:hypothetical protein